MKATLTHLIVAEEAILIPTILLVAHTTMIQLPAEAQMIGLARVQVLTTHGLQVLALLHGHHQTQVALVQAGVLLQVPILAHHGDQAHQVAMTQVAQAHTILGAVGN